MKNNYERMTKAELIKALRAAERQARPRAPKAGVVPYDRLVHDLRVHQEELEAQNRALREAQQLLEESRSRYADLYDLAPLGYVTFDGEGHIQEINLTGAAMLGIERSRLIAQPFSRYVANGDRPVFRKHLQRGETETEPRVTELHLSRKDGSTLYVELHSVPLQDAERKTRGCLTALTDITERKTMEQALHKAMLELRLSDERFRTALRNAPITVFNQDRDLNYTWAFNPWSTDLSDLTGKLASRIIPQFPLELDVAKQRVIETGIGTRRETFGTGFDGKEHFYIMAIDPLHNADGTTIGVTCAAIDITEYKRAGEHIEQLNRALELHAADLAMANQELDAFSSSVSHDLRTPLASIDGFSRLMLEDYAPQLPPEGQRYLNLIRENALAMNRLIDDLLSFSRTSRQPLQKQAVVTGDLVREVLANLASGQADRHVEVVIGDLPPCQADPALLTQVWVNLLSNAWKFTTKCDNPRIEIDSYHQENATVYFVKDNGAGFDMEQADRLFGVFQRLHSERDYPGTGVGLAIVNRIVRRHGGRVWAEGQVGQGACFYFTLDGGGG